MTDHTIPAEALVGQALDTVKQMLAAIGAVTTNLDAHKIDQNLATVSISNHHAIAAARLRLLLDLLSQYGCEPERGDVLVHQASADKYVRSVFYAMRNQVLQSRSAQ
jgi:hypothetical protein